MKSGSPLDNEIALVAERMQARRERLQRNALVLQLKMQSRVLRLARSPTLLTLGATVVVLVAWLRFKPRRKS
jgi:K+-transporting ATPase c subunit